MPYFNYTFENDVYYGIYQGKIFKLISTFGDIFTFNNRRLLHGRTAFDPNSGHRHLQGYYIDRDEIIGRLNYLKK